MATPFVAGAAAALISAGFSKNPVELRGHLMRHFGEVRGDHGGSDHRDPNVSGAGALALDKAMQHRSLMGRLASSVGAKAAVVAALAGLGVMTWTAREPIRSQLSRLNSGGVSNPSGKTPGVVHVSGTGVGEPSPPPARMGSPPRPGSVLASGRNGALKPQAGSVITRPGCFQFDPASGTLRLRVSRQATLSDLAIHFGTTEEALRASDPAFRSQLLADQDYDFPIDNLVPVIHNIRSGDSLGDLSWAYGAPSRFSVRTWNCLCDDTIRAGDRLLFLLPKDSKIAIEPETQPDRSRPGSWDLWEKEHVLRLTVTPRMTLSQLSKHMRMSLDDTCRACRRRGGLSAGDQCVFDISGLEARIHHVQEGDILAALTERYGAPTAYSIRAWNGLSTNTIQKGDDLLILVPEN